MFFELILPKFWNIKCKLIVVSLIQFINEEVSDSCMRKLFVQIEDIKVQSEVFRLEKRKQLTLCVDGFFAIRQKLKFFSRGFEKFFLKYRPLHKGKKIDYVLIFKMKWNNWSFSISLLILIINKRLCGDSLYPYCTFCIYCSPESWCNSCNKAYSCRKNQNKPHDFGNLDKSSLA